MKVSLKILFASFALLIAQTASASSVVPMDDGTGPFVDGTTRPLASGLKGQPEYALIEHHSQQGQEALLESTTNFQTRFPPFTRKQAAVVIATGVIIIGGMITGIVLADLGILQLPSSGNFTLPPLGWFPPIPFFR